MTSARGWDQAADACELLADILDAIGDIDIDRGWTVREGDQILNRIAAVLEGNA